MGFGVSPRSSAATIDIPSTSITTDDEAFIVETAKFRPEALGQPFTRWSLRKLVKFLADNDTRMVKLGRERLRQIRNDHGVTFQRTKTWKESNDPDRGAKLDRIEEVLDQHPDRCFAFDEFGPVEHPSGGWFGVGAPRRAATSAGQLQQAAWGPSVPRVLLGRRRRTVGCGPETQVGRKHASSSEVDPNRSSRRETDLCDLGQLVGA